MAHEQNLRRTLTLFDVYAISTGAMFSSGFFLLPGIAYASAGPSVFLAYLLAAVGVLPAMLSMAELSTAMPRAGGTYYFLDRALGPLVGTVGGLGAWLSLVLKTAFALVGMGAYLAFFVQWDVRVVAVALTAVFLVFNVVGAKESSGLQRILVTALVLILVAFLIEGLGSLDETGVAVRQDRFTPLLPHGAYGLLSTVGLVFVSYAGLTKVASVAEEIRDPDRNLPLGMALSLLTATVIYVVGVFIMVGILEPETLSADLTPVATAARRAATWLHPDVVLYLVVIAAIAAFASTANAGILSASRYLLAMGRDHLLPGRFARLGRFRTPTLSVSFTSALIVVCVLLLDVEALAKLASAFLLLLFTLVNLAVIVMRESRIEAYDPGYRSPLYPWVQIAGFAIPVWLVLEMGWLAIGFTAATIGLSILWYFLYAHRRLVREGAIYHVFARLGEQRFEGLDRELREILKEKMPRASDPFDELVAHAAVEDLPAPVEFGTLVSRAAARLGGVLARDAAEIERRFLEGTRVGMTPVSHGTALPHLRLPGIGRAQLLLVRCRAGVEMRNAGLPSAGRVERPVQAVFFLVSPEADPARHLRTLARLASRADEAGFLPEWLAAPDASALKETVVHEDRILSLVVSGEGPTADLAGLLLRDAPLHEGVLVALVRSGREVVVPTGGTVLKMGDRLTILGEPKALDRIRRRYGLE